MNYIADLHIHSPFSRATSPDSSPAGLAAWARIKGIQVVGTGDFTHPGWFKLLNETLEPAEPGLFKLKDEESIPFPFPGIPKTTAPVRFLLSAEISSIYKRHGKTRKVHNLLYLPDFSSVERINAKLAGIGNIESDGRPILGLDSRNLLEILLESSPDGFLAPAHIWTPWFSLFGSKSGFDSLEECYGDLSDQIFALETGLSSDPDMNRLITSLDHCALISNSDCHSPSKLGREANLFNTGFDFFSLRDALKSNNRDRFNGTIEFYPEEGKYHFDGHRACNVCLDPAESRRLDDICPVCGKPLTIGVHHRVLELADRTEPVYADTAPGFHSLIPLPELLGELLRVGPASRAVADQYARIIAHFGSEFSLLLHSTVEEIRDYNQLLAEAVQRMRSGQVIRKPGFDGEFGVIRVFEDGELEKLAGQGSLFSEVKSRRSRQKSKTIETLPKKCAHAAPDQPEALPNGPNPQQQMAIQAEGRRILVAAGPGTGKTYTLTARLKRLLDLGIDPGRVVAITFTIKAADELRERLAEQCGSASAKLFVGTFHRFCLEYLRRENPALVVVGPEGRERLFRRLFPEYNRIERNRVAAEVAAHFFGSGAPITDEVQQYVNELLRLNAIDLDAIIPVCVQLLHFDESFYQQMSDHVDYLFVDEFQDLNSAQYDLVECLAESASVFAIGDPDQAIYGFRGSDLRFFFRFAGMPGTGLLSLSVNYRSASAIIQGATAVINRNLIRSGLPLTPYNGSVKGVIELLSAPSPAAEAELIVRRIEELMGGVESFSLVSGRGGEQAETVGPGFSDIAILFRMGRQADELAEALSRRGIPFQLVGATPYYLASALRPVYYLIQAAAGTDITAEWLELFGALDGVGESTLSQLDATLPLQCDFFAALSHVQLTAAATSAATELRGMLQNFKTDVSTGGIGLALANAAAFVSVNPDHDDVQRLMLLSASFGSDLDAFSHHLRQYAAATVYDQRAEAVALMTCHSAKGLEFPIVFLSGMEEGLFPCTRMGNLDIEEERRLFYVALTRARERVILTSVVNRQVDAQQSRQISRFVSEIPSELLETPSDRPRSRKRRTVVTTQLELF